MKQLILLLFVCCSFTQNIWAEEEAVPIDENAEVTGLKAENHIPSLQTKSGQVGVGLQAGFQSGLTIEYWSAESRAWNLALTVEHGNPSASLSHLWMFRGAFPGDADPLVPFVGAGFFAVFGSKEDYLHHDGKSFVGAVQVPLGFEFLPEHARGTIFAEILPGIQVTPVSVGFTGVDGGARWYF